jgi:hypothetical protein
MAKVTILKHKRDENFKRDLLSWARQQDVKSLGVKFEEIPEFFQILIRFADELDVVRSIQESSDFITDEGLHRIAAELLEQFIREDTHHVIVDNVEVYEEDHVLIVLTD